MSQPYIRKAVEWLLACKDRTVVGETCLTYSDPGLRRQGNTASQTAWR
jgi:hypothetical protein